MWRRIKQMPITNAVLGLWVLYCLSGCTPAPPPPQSVDVHSYTFVLHLPDDFKGAFPFEARLLVVASDSILHVDLLKRRLGRDGARVSEVRVQGHPVAFSHRGRTLSVPLGHPHDSLEVHIFGTTRIPKSWLRDETFATDAWPDRTGRWLPVHAHPADVALHRFEISAPENMAVLASGTNTFTKVEAPGRVRHTFTGGKPLSPAAVSVIASYSMLNVQTTGRYQFWAEPHHVSLATALYPVMEEAIPWVEARLGPLPFSEIATVFTFTRFLGMEYAGLPRVNLDAMDHARAREVLVHEVVHQWIGAARFPAAPADLWVSEGFATYVTALYFEASEGRPIPQRLWHERALGYPGCVSQTLPTYDADLSPRVYERAALVWQALHALVGDVVFWQASRDLAQGQGVISGLDVKRTFEAHSGMDLGVFWQEYVHSRVFPPVSGGTEPCS